VNPPNNKYVLLLALLYFAVSLVGIIHHELWLDESQHWLLARDSDSIAGLIRNTKYEGHPVLWDLMLFVITRFTSNPFWMQFLHILISAATIIIFLRKAPFDWVFKMLFIFGYFMVFEYNVISRNYMPGVLFLFLACSVYPERKGRFPLFCLYLAFAANVHLIFSLIAFALFFTTVVEFISEKENLKSRLVVLGLLTFSIGIMLLAIQILRTDSDWFFDHLGASGFYERIAPGFISLFKGLLTVPDFTTIHFWNTNFLISQNKAFAAVAGALSYLLPIILFYKNKKIVFFIYAALLGAQVFFFVTQRSNARSDGMVYLVFIIALWLERCESSIPIGNAKFDFLKKPIVYTIITIQFLSGIMVYGMDIKYPFTASENVADYLNDNNLASKKIATVTCDCALISPYLRHKIYSLHDKDLESYCHWQNNDGEESYTVAKTSAMIAEFAEKNDFILVSNLPAVDSICSGADRYSFRIKKLKTFKDCILENSSFTIYEINHIR